MEESYLWKSGIAQYEMRLIIEGALVLYENEASSLLSLAMKHQDYEDNAEDESDEDSEAKTDDKSNSDSE